MGDRSQFQEHSLINTILLHLFPGIMGGIAYFLLVDFVSEMGFPSIFALILAGIVALVPLQSGYLLIQSRKENKKHFSELLAFRERISPIQILVWSFVALLISALITMLFMPISTQIQKLFSWMPEIFLIDMGLDGAYSKPILIVTYIFYLGFVVLIVPTIEELYFRGYLFPRMPPKLGKWNYLLHGLLFGLYHTWSPWLFLSRTFAIQPLLVLIRKKNNLWIAIIAHCVLNSIDFFIGVAFIANM